MSNLSNPALFVVSDTVVVISVRIGCRKFHFNVKSVFMTGAESWPVGSRVDGNGMALILI